MIPKDSNLFYSLYTNEEGDNKGNGRKSVGKAVIVSRVPTETGNSPPSNPSPQASKSPRRSLSPDEAGRRSIPSEEKTITGSPRRSMSPRVSIPGGKPAHKDFIQYYPSDELEEFPSSVEDEASNEVNNLDDLKKRHDSIFTIDGDTELSAEEENKVESIIRQELQENRTVKKPFEKGTNILVFIGIATGLSIVLGYSILSSFVRTGDKPKEKKEENTELLTKEKNPLQERIDQLEAERAIRDQNNRSRKSGGALPSDTTTSNGSDLGSLLSPGTANQPTEENPASRKAQDEKNTAEEVTGKQADKKPAVAPQKVETVPPPPPVVVPPPPQSAPVADPMKIQLDYLALRQTIRQFGSFGMPNSGTRSPAIQWNENSPSPPPSASGNVSRTSGTQSPSRSGGTESNEQMRELQEAERQFLARLPVQKQELSSSPVPSSPSSVSQILPSTRIPGRIMSPIFGVENYKDESRYPILVEEDIVDVNGEVRIPRHAMIMVVVNSMQSGLFLLKPVSVVLNDKEVPLPEGSIDIRGRNRPLLGNVVSGNQLKAIRDTILLFLLGGGQSAAELANRPRTTSSSSSAVSGALSSVTNSSVTTTPEPDYGAAALSGGLNKVIPRLESEIKRKDPRENDLRVYQLNSGTNVDIYIMRSLNL